MRRRCRPDARLPRNRFRQEHGISLAEHQGLLEQNDWTEEEFEAGFQKGVAPRDGSKDLLKYEALVQRELGKGEVSVSQQFLSAGDVWLGCE